VLAKSNEIAIKQILLNRDASQNLPKNRIVFIAGPPSISMFVVIEFPITEVFVSIEQSFMKIPRVPKAARVLKKTWIAHARLHEN